MMGSLEYSPLQKVSRVGDEQVSFEVNLDSVARSGVRIHPSVLQLSRRKSAAQ